MKTSIEFESKTITISSRHIGIDSPEWAHGYKKHHYKVKVLSRTARASASTRRTTGATRQT